MDIPLNLEYISSLNNFDFYLKSTYGFEDRKLALKEKLFENFGSDKSTYFEIFKNNYFSHLKMEQLWCFDINTEKPIGLYLFIEFENQDQFRNIGQIHLFTKQEYRNQGLSKEAAKIFNKKIFNKYGDCFILMNDDAYYFAKHLPDLKITSTTYNEKTRHFSI